jgi:predicted nucleic acid-binding protein
VIFVDTNVLIDVLEDDPVWSGWSARQLESVSRPIINTLIIGELAPGYETLARLLDKLAMLSIEVESLPEEVAFLGGTRFATYRRSSSGRGAILSDFLIAAHALTLGVPLLTRDSRLYRRYFPELTLITPETDDG